MNIKRPRRKSNSTLIYIMIALIAALCAVLIFWNPEEPKDGNGAAADAQKEMEQKIADTTIAKEGSMAPDFTVEMVSGEKITLSDLRGKVVLLNFWATWCPPCREELKHVQAEIIDRFKGEEFVFIPVSRGEEKSTVEEFRKSTGYGFPMGLDPEQNIYRLYASNYIPRNFLIDRDGKIVLASVGYDTDEFAELIKTIEKTINGK